MLISFIRTIILYFLIVIAMRVMGKRQVGQLEPTELVITMMISDLATIPMEHVSFPLVIGVIPILTLMFAETTISFINLKSRRFRKLISGAPIVVVKDGLVLEDQLKKLRLNMDDLMEELRMNQCPDIQDIAYAVFETNGNLSIIEKSAERTAEPKDFGLNPKYKGLPFLFVCDGEVNQYALKIYKKDTRWLIKEISKQGAKNVRDVLLAGVDESGTFYMQKRGVK